MNCEICDAEVTENSVRYEKDVLHCRNCVGSDKAKELIESRLNESSKFTRTTVSDGKPTPKKNVSALANSKDKYSLLSKVFFVLSGLSLLGGFFLCIIMWLESRGEQEEIIANAFLFAGIVQSVLYAALGQGLHYLRKISESAALIASRS